MNEELAVVTEIGVFGELEITDPTKRVVKESEMDKLIQDTHLENLKNLK